MVTVWRRNESALRIPPGWTCWKKRWKKMTLWITLSGRRTNFGSVRISIMAGESLRLHKGLDAKYSHAPPSREVKLFKFYDSDRVHKERSKTIHTPTVLSTRKRKEATFTWFLGLPRRTRVKHTSGSAERSSLKRWDRIEARAFFSNSFLSRSIYHKVSAAVYLAHS